MASVSRLTGWSSGSGGGAAIVILGIVCATAATARAQQDQSRAGSRTAATGGPAAAVDQIIVARVDGKPIYKADVDKALAGQTAGQRVEPAVLPQLQAAFLDRLIKQRLLFNFIEDKDNKLAATREQADKEIEHLRAALKQQNVTLDQYLRQSGQTMAQLSAQAMMAASLTNFFERYATAETIEAYYGRNARHFDGSQLRVSHILLRPTQSGDDAEMAALKKQAEQIKADIEAGKTSFAEAAKQYSAGPSRHEGGDLGFIARKSPMVEAFNRAAFDLEQGKISEPVMTNFGIHLITVTDIKPGNKKLDDVRQEVLKAIQPWLIEKLVERQMKTAKIEFNGNFPHFKPGTQELATAEK